MDLSFETTGGPHIFHPIPLRLHGLGWMWDLKSLEHGVPCTSRDGPIWDGGESCNMLPHPVDLSDQKLLICGGN